VPGKILAWNNSEAVACPPTGARQTTSEFREMQKATCLCVSGMLLFFGTASPTFAQVTTLNGDDARNSPNASVGNGTVQGLDGAILRPSTDYSTGNSLIVTGPVDEGGAVPDIDLDKFTREHANDNAAEKN
jgi:hypothetical protein